MMAPLLLHAIILFTVALVLYTLSVWSEKVQQHLRIWPWCCHRFYRNLADHEVCWGNSIHFSCNFRFYFAVSIGLALFLGNRRLCK